MDHALILFAQMRQQPRPPEFGPGNFVMLGVQCVLAVVFLAVQIMYLVTLYRAFNNISARNRTMEPGMVFLDLIPLFGLVWHFFVVIRLAESLKNEFRDHGMRTADEGFGYGAGMTMAIGQAICCGIVAIVGMVMHWVQIAGYSSRLASKANKKRRRDEDEDDDDPRPSKRRRRDEDDDE